MEISESRLLDLRNDTSDEVSGNRCSAWNNFGKNLWTSAPYVNFGTEFHWNVNFGIM